MKGEGKRTDFSYLHVDYDKLPERLHDHARVVRGVGNEEHDWLGSLFGTLSHWLLEQARVVIIGGAAGVAVTTPLSGIAVSVTNPPLPVWVPALFLTFTVAVVVAAISGQRREDRALRLLSAASKYVTPKTLGAGEKSSSIREADEVSRATDAGRAIVRSSAWNSGYLDAQRVRLNVEEETRQIAWQCQRIYDLRGELGRGDGGSGTAASDAAKAARTVRAEHQRQLDVALAGVRRRVDALASYAEHVAALDTELTALKELERAESLTDRIEEVVAQGGAANELATAELEQLRDQLAAAQASVKDLVQLLRTDVATLQPAER